MTSSSNYLCQTLSSVARQIVGRPILAAGNCRVRFEKSVLGLST